MVNFRKTLTASLAALTLGGAMLATSTAPAAAWGGYGWNHHGYGWGGPAVAAGVIGGLALAGAAAGAGAYDYGTCVSRAPAYDAYGYFIGYRRVRVAC